MIPQEKIFVICVDSDDKSIGSCEKLLAHERGLLHRATSVILTTPPTKKSEPKILLQKRSMAKYHSPGLWAPTACTHPLAHETPEEAARRSLKKELGISLKILAHMGYFIYRTEVGDDLIEHELDHVFLGHWDEKKDIPFSPQEVDCTRWVTRTQLDTELSTSTHEFVQWFPYLLAYIDNPLSKTDFRQDYHY